MQASCDIQNPKFSTGKLLNDSFPKLWLILNKIPYPFLRI